MKHTNPTLVLIHSIEFYPTGNQLVPNLYRLSFSSIHPKHNLPI